MRFRLPMVTGLVMLAAASAVSAGPILQDQDNGALQIDYFEPVGQSFTAEDSSISFGFFFDVINFGFPADEDITISLLEGDGAFGTLLAQSTFNLTEGFVGYHDVDFSSVSLNVGSQYTAVLNVPGSSPYWAIRYASGYLGDFYTGGHIVFGNRVPNYDAPNNQAFSDTRFRVTPNAPPTSVPEPATAAMFLGGLAALAFRRRRNS